MIKEILVIVKLVNKKDIELMGVRGYTSIEEKLLCGTIHFESITDMTEWSSMLVAGLVCPNQSLSEISIHFLNKISYMQLTSTFY